jgi:sigma-B regulation protein RsbU (phosphoserine phosphatase)
MEQPERFASFFYCCLDAACMTLTYCNAGHHPPLLVRADGTVERLSVGGLLLGVERDTAYEEESVELREGDVIVIYTDGIIEQSDGHDFFGEERLVQLVKAHAGLSASLIKKKIVDAVTEFSPDGKNDDDLTLVVVKVY